MWKLFGRRGRLGSEEQGQHQCIKPETFPLLRNAKIYIFSAELTGALIIEYMYRDLRNSG